MCFIAAGGDPLLITQRLRCATLVFFLALPLGIPAVAEEVPPTTFQTRTLYAPGHFGNSYEVMGQFEMREVLEEARFWGFNEYGDWFDTIDCADPFSDKHYNLAGALWDRKKENFQSAQELGLNCILIITPNHVFLDQIHPDWEATKSNRIFGQLVCPSIPKGRAIILQNYRNLFEDLNREGVRLSALSFAPYDYGGCACSKCSPWILTFANLCREIHGIAEEFHPEIEARFIGWWWSDEEHRLFAEWANVWANGWVKSLALHIPYGKTGVSEVPLPDGCERHAFVHIGYGDASWDRDIYGHLGPVCAGTRIEETLLTLEQQEVTGWMAYSEGVFDDVNKALIGGMSASSHHDSDEVLRSYSQRYFKADTTASEAWADWLQSMGHPFETHLPDSRKIFSRLTQEDSATNWRLNQWDYKIRMLEINRAIEETQGWTDGDTKQALEYWKTKEEMQRRAWGLGPQRHVLGNRFKKPSWFGDWVKHRGIADEKSK